MRRIDAFIIFLFVMVSSGFSRLAFSQSGNDTLTAMNLAAFNSMANDIFPIVSPDGNQIYYTVQYRHLPSQIFVADKDPAGHWSNPNEVKSFSNLGTLGSLTFDSMGTCYFACQVKNKPSNDYDIFQIKNGKATSVGDAINSIKWESEPSVTLDGKTLYFASNRNSGSENPKRVELFVSHLLPNGSWSEPNSLGRKINSGNFTGCPFIAEDNATLFFTSEVNGQLQLFVSVNIGGSDSSWSDPEELPYPINGEGESMSACLSPDGHEFYFSSSRPGGKGGFDLYEVLLSDGMNDLYKRMEKK
jgi:Tol biopolymer transport system component